MHNPLDSAWLWIDHMFHKMPVVLQNIVIYIVVYSVFWGGSVYFLSRPYTQ